jgi:hypothetical protein
MGSFPSVIFCGVDSDSDSLQDSQWDDYNNEGWFWETSPLFYFDMYINDINKADTKRHSI